MNYARLFVAMLCVSSWYAHAERSPFLSAHDEGASERLMQELVPDRSLRAQAMKVGKGLAFGAGAIAFGLYAFDGLKPSELLGRSGNLTRVASFYLYLATVTYATYLMAEHSYRSAKELAHMRDPQYDKERL